MPQLNPYLNFKDNAREAMEFYHSVFGGTIEMHTYDEYPQMPHPETEANKIMHSMVQTDSGITFFAADTPDSMEYKPGSNFNMSLNGDSDDETTLRGYFEKLAEGGAITMPLETAPWGAVFGALVDKFGVNWMVNIAGQPEQPQA
jgi:PhnB protein